MMEKATFISLSPLSPNCTDEFDSGTCESDPDYMKTICNNNTICGKS